MNEKFSGSCMICCFIRTFVATANTHAYPFNTFILFEEDFKYGDSPKF